MDSTTRVPGLIGQRALLITTLAVPLTGWAVHATALHRRLAASRVDPLTGLLRRDAYTHRARRLLARHGDTATVVMVDADRFKAINDQLGHATGDTVLAASVGAATPNTVGSRDLSVLQRAADAALYDGKHTGRAVLATAAHAAVPSLNGRRAGRPGTAVWGRAA
ncbi:diguanylate cyclase [Streptomyces sp. WAC02707]|uniref:diguanylate cyclase n=1 Tax=Streptomyces sp. WAC02707 TaxID=2487417 RepID=UPI000F78436F|nr:diguanylate cyclase [Streptomyces sp. WAC02707]RSS80961.1 diguanylate cyclase [Streptomyces sp. WAC02707]